MSFVNIHLCSSAFLHLPSTPPPTLSFLPHALCGLSCLLTVPKHDEPFSPMGISPPSKQASATSVSISQSGCSGSSLSSSVAVSSDLAQASGSFSVTLGFNLAEGRHISSSQAQTGRKKVLSCPLSQLKSRFY